MFKKRPVTLPMIITSNCGCIRQPTSYLRLYRPSLSFVLIAYASPFKRRIPKYKAVLHDEGPKSSVTGVAKLYDRLFVAYHQSSIIHVHGAGEPFVKLAEITVKELRRPWDVAVCRMRHCIYVTDCGTNRLWRLTLPELERIAEEDSTTQPMITLPKNAASKNIVGSIAGPLLEILSKSDRSEVSTIHEIVRLPDVATDEKMLTIRAVKILDGIGAPHTVSVTRGGQLLLARTRPLCLDVFEPDAGGRHPLRRIMLPPDIVDPQHAVETPTGTFFVSHGDGDKEDEIPHRVCEIEPRHPPPGAAASVVDGNAEVGLLVRSTEGSLVLRMPRHLAPVDGGGVLVADCNNGHVLHLDSRLRLRRILLDEPNDDLHEPRRLVYDPRTGELILAQRTGFRNVKIFNTHDLRGLKAHFY